MISDELFRFLRAALWNTPIETNADASLLAEVLKEAEKQTVAPLVFKAMEQAKCQLPRQVVLRQMTLRQQTILQNRKINLKLGALAELMQQSQTDYVVVKGQVLAACYPHPELRQSGDIDFYCDEANFDRGLKCLMKQWEINDAHWDAEVLEFHHEGILLEMHHTLAHFYNKRKDAYWKQLLKDIPAAQITIGNQPVNTLNPTLHSLYVWIHLYHHLLELGVGLRQFCDWAMILHHCKDEIDHEALKKHLQVLGLEKAYKASGSVLVNYLGLPADEFTYPLTAQDSRYAPKILDVVFYRGNMGKYNKRNGFQGWKHQVESFGIKSAHFLKFYPLAPRYMRDWMGDVIKEKVL